MVSVYGVVNEKTAATISKVSVEIPAIGTVVFGMRTPRFISCRASGSVAWEEMGLKRIYGTVCRTHYTPPILFVIQQISPARFQERGSSDPRGALL